MKRITFRELLVALLLFCSASAWAYDFSAENDDGVTIYYNITSEEGAEVKTVEVTKNISYNGDVNIPETVTYDGTTYTVSAIGYHAFYNDTELTSVEIPNSVTSIGEFAFWQTALTSIEIPSSVTSIGRYVFYWCSHLASANIPSGVTSIEEYTFFECSSLTSIEIPSSVTSIGDYAFYNCSALTSLVMSGGVTSIGKYAFENCAGLTSLVIPSSVTSIGESAFYKCSGLTSLVISEGVESIAVNAFGSCTSLTSVNIPNSVTTIGTQAFANCSSLKEVTIGEGLLSAGDQVFYNENISVVNYNATSVSSNGGGPIFGTCTIDTFNIGANVTKMRAFTIFSCTVSELYSPSSTPPTLDSNAFSSSTFGVIFVPEDESATYASTDGWNSLSNIIEMTVTIPMTTDEGYVTRYSPYSYVLEKGLKGGVITDADAEGALTIEWLYDGDSTDSTKYTVPADLAILIKGPANATSTSAENHSFVNWTINTDNDTYPKPATNMLYGTVVSDDANAKTYVLDENGEDVSSNYYFYKLSHYTQIDSIYTETDTTAVSTIRLGFYWGVDGGGQIPLVGSDSAGDYSGIKLAWLAIPKSTFPDSTSAKGVFYPLEDADENTPSDSDDEMETTGITTVAATSDSGAIYNLQGVRVSDMSKKGIYIVNGRKVIKK